MLVYAKIGLAGNDQECRWKNPWSVLVVWFKSKSGQIAVLAPDADVGVPATAELFSDKSARVKVE